MTGHEDLLDKRQHDDLSHETPIANSKRAKLRPRVASVFTSLAARLFAGPEKVKVVGFAALSAGEGVTVTIQSVAYLLKEMNMRLLIVQAEELLSTSIASDRHEHGASRIQDEQDHRRQADPEYQVLALRREFDAVLLDFGSLDCSPELIRVAALTDGVVLVVEAGKWHAEQVKRGADTIRQAGTRVLGVVLNKRQYPIPRWLYRLLQN